MISSNTIEGRQSIALTGASWKKNKRIDTLYKDKTNRDVTLKFVGYYAAVVVAINL